MAKGIRPYVQVELRQADVDALVKELMKLSDKMRKKIVVEAMMAGGMIHLAAAKALVPRGRTGHLKASLTIRKLAGRGSDSAGGARVMAQRGRGFPGGYYAHLVERGHKIFFVTKGKKKVYIGFYGGSPFMRPAIEQNRDRILNEIKKVVKTGIDSHFPGAK